eukprot:scaffold680283_cov42-Prasinocladus_malaysianus.AAC.1
MEYMEDKQPVGFSHPTVAIVTMDHQMPSSTPSKYEGGNIFGLSLRSRYQTRWPETMRASESAHTSCRTSCVKRRLPSLASGATCRPCCVSIAKPSL